MLSTSQPDAPLAAGPELPPFVRPEEIGRGLAEGLRPPPRMAVSTAAERHRILHNPGAYSGPWRNRKTPYLPEIMDRLTSRDCDEGFVVAPSQTAKTEIILNFLAHGIIYRPWDALVLQETRDLAADFTKRRFDKGMIKISPDLQARLGSDRSDDNIFTKQFVNGMMISIGWCVKGQVSSRPLPNVLLDELDRMPRDVGGEGDPVVLGRKRKRTFKRNGVLLAVSSPSRDFDGGIVGYFATGNRHLRFWRCWSCDEHFAPGFGFDRKPLSPPCAHFDWPKDVSIDEAAEQVVMICPHCGAIIPERAKAELDESGVWLPEGQRLTAAGEIRGDRPRTRIWSWWVSGYISQLMTWGEMLHEYLTARGAFDKTQDDEKLKACVNTTFGFPFQSEKAGQAPIEIAELERRKEDWELGTVPPGVRFLTAAVDNKIHGFSVGVEGWNEHGESWQVDRFEIDSLADGSQPDPANVAEHWDLLLGRVIGRGYPLREDPGQELVVACTALDIGGAAGTDEEGESTEGVSLHVRNFARRLLRQGLEPWRVMLVKGSPNRRANVLPQTPTHETDDRGKRRADSVPLYVIGVHRLQNIVDTRLRLGPAKPDDALYPRRPGYRHFPHDVPEFYLEELTAEEKVKGKWTRTGPNESRDLAVYNEAVRQKLRLERVKWDRPPAWARPRARQGAPAVVAIAAQAAAPGKRRVRYRLID